MTASIRGGGKYPVKVVSVYPGIDACVARIDGVYVPPVKFSSKPPRYGARVYSLAAPLGLYSSEMLPKFEGFYSGSVYRTRKPSPWVGYFDELDLYTIPTRGGSSGAPIFNENGEVVGIIIMATARLESLCWSPTFESIRPIWLAIEREVYGKEKKEKNSKVSWERRKVSTDPQDFTPEPFVVR
jgi:hypothetical protein